MTLGNWDTERRSNLLKEICLERPGKSTQVMAHWIKMPYSQKRERREGEEHNFDHYGLDPCKLSCCSVQGSGRAQISWNRCEVWECSTPAFRQGQHLLWGFVCSFWFCTHSASTNRLLLFQLPREVPLTTAEWGWKLPAASVRKVWV